MMLHVQYATILSSFTKKSSTVILKSGNVMRVKIQHVQGNFSHLDVNRICWSN